MTWTGAFGGKSWMLVAMLEVVLGLVRWWRAGDQ